MSTEVRLLANMTSLLEDNNLRGALAEKLPNYPNLDRESSGGLSLRKGISQAINVISFMTPIVFVLLTSKSVELIFWDPQNGIE